MSNALSHEPDSSDTNGAAVAPKILGADVELGNFILGLDSEYGTGAKASRALLREINGLPWPAPSASGYWIDQINQPEPKATNPQDWGRKYLPANGGCFYIDLDHLECCTPEVLSAYDFAAAFHAMLRIARTALRTANARLPEGVKLVAVVNNVDGHNHSWAHISICK